MKNLLLIRFFTCLWYFPQAEYRSGFYFISLIDILRMVASCRATGMTPYHTIPRHSKPDQIGGLFTGDCESKHLWEWRPQSLRAHSQFVVVMAKLSAPPCHFLYTAYLICASNTKQTSGRCARTECVRWQQSEPRVRQGRHVAGGPEGREKVCCARCFLLHTPRPPTCS